MQLSELHGDDKLSCGKKDCNPNEPQRTLDATITKTERLAVLATKDGYAKNPRESRPENYSLRQGRAPNRDHDQAEADGEF